MAMQADSWECTREGLRHAQTLVSFQRFPKPAGPLAVEAVRSYGALPPGQVGTEILLPLPDDDAFWIGVILSGEGADGLSLHADLADGRRIALSGVRHASLLSIMGFADGDALQPFTRPRVTSIGIGIGSDTRSVKIVSPDEFTRLTGRNGPEALPDDSAYKGWRLP